MTKKNLSEKVGLYPKITSETEYEVEILSAARRRLVVHLLYFRLISKLRNSLKTLG
jgi:hypothetical protein